LEGGLVKAKASIRLKFPSSKQLKTVEAALSPEVSKPSFESARITLQSEGRFLVLNVEADDTVALRRALNTYLRWMSSTVNVVQVLDEKS
jgi:tRNA threonylcarbamoyladenosine modification (KEOPS) complex  Pcc1 subunit